MSKPSQSFRTYLLTKTGVTDEVSTRIYPGYLPKNATLPAVVFNVISQVPAHHLGAAAEVTEARIQLDIFAATRSAVEDAAEAIRNAGDGYRGAAGSEFFQMCRLDSQQDFHDDPSDASDVRRYRISQDWLIAVTETAPTL